jgi:hypothetical protein
MERTRQSRDITPRDVENYRPLYEELLKEPGLGEIERLKIQLRLARMGLIEPIRGLAGVWDTWWDVGDQAGKTNRAVMRVEVKGTRANGAYEFATGTGGAAKGLLEGFLSADGHTLEGYWEQRLEGGDLKAGGDFSLMLKKEPDGRDKLEGHWSSGQGPQARKLRWWGYRKVDQERAP